MIDLKRIGWAQDKGAEMRVGGIDARTLKGVVRTDGLAEEDSLAENIQRAPIMSISARHADAEATLSPGMIVEVRARGSAGRAVDRSG